MRQNKYSSISAFMSLRSSLRLPLRARLGLAPKYLSGPLRGRRSRCSLSLRLAEGRNIKDSLRKCEDAGVKNGLYLIS